MQGLTYHVDIAICMDITASMTPILEKVKQRALDFYNEVTEALDKKDKHVDELRIRVVGFRDVGLTDTPAFETSPFFKLPDQQEDFFEFVKSLEPRAGGDAPESGLEAIAVALHSDWTTTGDKRRQIIVVWTDAPTHEYGRGHESIPPQYKEMIPANKDDLYDLWHDDQGGLVNVAAKRLILFAPDGQGWTEVSESWNNVVHFPSRAGDGLRDFEYEEILGFIAESV